MTGQLRGGLSAVLGWDLGAALALARARGLNTFVVAELIPAIEAVAIRRINEQLEARRHG